jgi:hypothetical protein
MLCIVASIAWPSNDHAFIDKLVHEEHCAHWSQTDHNRTMMNLPSRWPDSCSYYDGPDWRTVRPILNPRIASIVPLAEYRHDSRFWPRVPTYMLTSPFSTLALPSRTYNVTSCPSGTSLNKPASPLLAMLRNDRSGR